MRLHTANRHAARVRKRSPYFVFKVGECFQISWPEPKCATLLRVWMDRDVVYDREAGIGLSARRLRKSA